MYTVDQPPKIDLCTVKYLIKDTMKEEKPPDKGQTKTTSEGVRTYNLTTKDKEPEVQQTKSSVPFCPIFQTCLMVTLGPTKSGYIIVRH